MLATITGYLELLYIGERPDRFFYSNVTLQVVQSLALGQEVRITNLGHMSLFHPPFSFFSIQMACIIHLFPRKTSHAF